MMQQKHSLSLGPTSDLVVAAEWLPGIIQADEPILPATRLAVTFRVIFALRRLVCETLEFAPFADPIEQLEQIHSFRLAAEPAGMRLAVTYDFGWEPYLRALWHDAGPFLDLLCCHCKDYKLARSTPLHEWQQWILNHQVPSDYFYSATPLTVGDLAALRQSERMERDDPDSAAVDRLLAGFSSRSAEQIVQDHLGRFPDEAARQGIRVIAIMYRLTRYWTADVEHSVNRADAITLIRGTRALIDRKFREPGELPPVLEQQFKTELAWYRQQVDGQAPQPPARAEPKLADIQRGILTAYERGGARITHGAAVFLAITDADAARRSLAKLRFADEKRAVPKDGVFRNLAFTFGGLQNIRKSSAVLDAAPAAFREGAAARAGRVGDVRSFDPANWQPLKRNWHPDPDWTVELALVDVLIQLRIAADGRPTGILDPGHPLKGEIAHLAALPGLALLAVEGLAPAGRQDGSDVNHLGFREGLSQPTLAGPETQPWSDRVEPGVLLVGRDDAPADPFWQDGSFLALRRMPIDRERFEAAIRGDCRPALNDPALLAAKMIGRMPDGTPLVPGDGPNNFVYDGDATGTLCPLGSHVRRANPRVGQVPRIMRRGMSFGPPAGADGGERGSLFMAYCADLAEQYERVLSWVNGGNSTRTGSYLADPLTGVPDLGASRTFRFLHRDAVHRLALPPAGEGFVGLSWSLYLFAPSLAAIRGLAKAEPASPDPAQAQIAYGRTLIAALEKAEAGTWRALLNEPGARDSGRPQAVWAAIRADRGILETPAGYLVARYDLVMEVLRDDGHRFSNRGAGMRMEQSIGPFHLGLDPCTKDYQTLSRPANAALRSIDEETAFRLGREKAIETIGRILEGQERSVTIDLLKDLIEPMLGLLGAAWFDIPDRDHVELGSQTWEMPDGRKPRFPGDFWSPSRQAFNPFGSDETDRLAKLHGHATVAAVTQQIAAVGRDKLRAPVSAPMAAATDAYPSDADLARVLVGSMIGAVPTFVVNATRLLGGGIETGSLARAQMDWLTIGAAGRTYAEAVKRFRGSIVAGLQGNPVPELLWRVVVQDDMLGGQPLKQGRALIFSLESAGLDRAARKIADPWIPFGMAPPGEQPTPHGCPGRAMAIGALLGLLVGLIEAARFKPAGATATAELWPLR